MARGKEERTASLARHVKTMSHNIDYDSIKDIANMGHNTRRMIREGVGIENSNTRDIIQYLTPRTKVETSPQ